MVRSGCPWEPDTFRVAATNLTENQNLKLYCWLRDHKEEIPEMKFKLKSIVKRAIARRKTTVLTWCLEDGFLFDGWAWIKAAKHKSVEAMQLLWENKIPWDDRLFKVVWQSQSKRVTRWLFGLIPLPNNNKI